MSNQSNQNENEQKSKKPRAIGVFPRLGLKKIIELVTAIYEMGEGERVRRLRVFDKLGKSPSSGPSKLLVTTSNSGYGLVEGSYIAEFLQLTQRGKDIVASGVEHNKYKAIYDALFSNDIFSGFINRFNGRQFPPDVDIVTDYLKRDHGLSDDDAKTCWNVLRENIIDFGLTQELSGKTVVITREMAMENFDNPLTPTPSVKIEQRVIEDPTVDPSNEISLPSYSRHSKDSIAPQFNFNIQIQLPENASPEVYESIFKSIATHLLKHDEE